MITVISRASPFLFVSGADARARYRSHTDNSLMKSFLLILSGVDERALFAFIIATGEIHKEISMALTVAKRLKSTAASGRAAADYPLPAYFD